MGLNLAAVMPPEIESIIKILLAAVCGFLMGLERKSRNQVVGMRTLILICVSSCLLSELSSFMAESGVATQAGGDPTRIAAGVISGVGFLGAGAIIKQGLNIKGLTSAAIIWTAASFGLAVGAGLYIPAAVALVLVLILLLGLERVEAKLFPAEKTKTLKICFDDEKVDMDAVRHIISSHDFVISDMNVGHVTVGQEKGRQVELDYLVKSPAEFDFFPIIEELKSVGNLRSFSITD